jgi:hypothetical protein
VGLQLRESGCKYQQDATGDRDPDGKIAADFDVLLPDGEFKEGFMFIA